MRVAVDIRGIGRQSEARQPETDGEIICNSFEGLRRGKKARKGFICNVSRTTREDVMLTDTLLSIRQYS